MEKHKMGGEIVYSGEINGDARNYNWSVKFDKSGGYLRIVQTHEDGKLEIVLLSPKQVVALKKFIK